MHGLPGLKYKRIAAGLTQEQLAQLVGVHPMSISRYELGNQNARYSVIERIARILACTAQELMFPEGTDEPIR